jgi:type II secretory pathway pseudopilin PulG
MNKLNLKIKHKQTTGFTIIEVVLVLAIAGLIFLMVFIALPALQRSQRDTQRKNDMATLLDAYERCRANNQGQCSISRAVFGGYIRDDNWRDPSTGERYELAILGGAANNYDYVMENLQIGQIAADSGAGCDQNGRAIDLSPDGGPRQQYQANIIIKLENGGLHCTSNRQIQR